MGPRTICGIQNLSYRHPNPFFGQAIQPLYGILNLNILSIRLSQQSHEI